MIFTVGHSTQTAAEFLALLQAYGVALLADVRTVPRSKRHPHFSAGALAAFLQTCGIEYTHLPDLGGLRKPRPDSPNGGWRHAAFRGYADHMQTREFAAGLDRLIVFARDRQAAIMCAEARWWQCHRQLIADALVARQIEVRHIMSLRDAPRHELTAFARVANGQVVYPALV
ncbi:MAG TPA: DUF488 domain-containing protein [Vicinamibacterales bacterium]